MKKMILVGVLLLGSICFVIGQESNVGNAFSDVEGEMLLPVQLGMVDGGINYPNRCTNDATMTDDEKVQLDCDKALHDSMQADAKARAEKDARDLEAYANAALGLAAIGTAFIPGPGPAIAAGIGTVVVVHQCRADRD